MTALQLIISPQAKADLKDIWQFGFSRWGRAQSDNYLEALKGQIWTLLEQPNMGTARNELLAGTRSLPVASHTLYYRIRENNLELIRVLHGRQDPGRHLIGDQARAR